MFCITIVGVGLKFVLFLVSGPRNATILRAKGGGG
jgi:hypothetical protein